MLGTKLLLLSLVVYASGQGLTYNGGSNVRTQGRLPPRPLGPYRPAYTPNAEPIRPIYNLQPVNQPPQPEQPAIQPDQPALQPQPAYQPPQPNQPALPNQPRYQPQPIYQPPQPNQPTSPNQPRYQPRPVYQPPQPIYNPEPSMPAPVVPETPPQPIYIPPQPAISARPTPRPINSYPRPLPPWSWKPVQPTEAPAEAITSDLPATRADSSLPNYSMRAVDFEPPIESSPESAPVEQPTNVQPEAEETPLSSNPEDRVPGPSAPEPLPELTIPSDPELRPIPEEPLSDPIPDPEQPVMLPDPLIPIEIPQLQPDSQPEESYPNPIPFQPIPMPGPNITHELQPITPEPVIPYEPTLIVPKPNYPPKEPLAPVENVPVFSPPSRPIQPLQPPKPIQPPRPNYRPIPLAPSPEPTIPNYQPLQPLAPTNPIPVNPGIPPHASTYPEPSQPTAEPTIYYPITPPTGSAQQPDISLIIPMTEFQCTKGNGYYTIINECDAYIKCQGQRAYKHTCPDGLHFNPVALYPEYPCAYPSEVQCESTASKQTARPTNECPNRYGFFPISGGDCSKYLMCQEGKATPMNCPFGLVFNDQLSSCDWPENVPQCNPSAFKDFNCPIPPEDDPDRLTRYRYGSDCGMYVACQRGHPRLLRCDIGLFFDENSQVCIDSDLVTECNITNTH